MDGIDKAKVSTAHSPYAINDRSKQKNPSSASSPNNNDVKADDTPNKITSTALPSSEKTIPTTRTFDLPLMTAVHSEKRKEEAYDDDDKAKGETATSILATNNNNEIDLQPVEPDIQPAEPSVSFARYSASFHDEGDIIVNVERNQHLDDDSDADEPVAVMIVEPNRHDDDDDDHDHGVRPINGDPMAGINQDETSQQHPFLCGKRDATEEELDNTELDFRIEAKPVDEDQLFQEMLTRRRHSVVEAEALDRPNVENDDDEIKGKKGTTRRTIAAAIVAIAVVIVIVVVVTAVLVSRSNKKSKQQSPRPSPAKPTAPQPGSVSLLEKFRSELLNQNVTSRKDLDEAGSAQSQALNWLANERFLNESASVASIIDRYVLAVVYFADTGYHWKNQSGFLSFDSICAWHSSVTGTGAFCKTTTNGNYNYIPGCE
jgi:hypothetical protein